MAVTKNIMAYYSLPRLERIGASMHWESGILYQNERWLSSKVFLTYRFLVPMFLKYSMPIFVNCWINNYGYSNAPWGREQRATPFFKLQNRTFLREKHQKTRILNHYIYKYNNKYITLVLFLKKPKNIDTFKRRNL